VREALGQRMQTKEQDAESDNRDQQNARHHHHKNICLAGRRDERRKMLNSGRVKRFGRQNVAPNKKISLGAGA
jgi:hypothetical protein